MGTRRQGGQYTAEKAGGKRTRVGGTASHKDGDGKRDKDGDRIDHDGRKIKPAKVTAKT